MPRGRLGGLGGGSPGPYPGGRLRGLARAGLQAHTRGEVERSGPGLGVQAQGGVSQHALRQTPPADGYCCGRYASYWNAFLFPFESVPFPVPVLIPFPCGVNKPSLNYT